MTLLSTQSDLLRDPVLALSLLTRLPLRLSDAAFARSAHAAWAYPLVGLVTGSIGCAAAWLALWIGLPVWCAAILALAAGLLVTGAMHEDGLADCADGFWGGWDPAMRLKIMSDSQIGTYGVLALGVITALRFGAISTLVLNSGWELALIAVHVASRSVMPVLMLALPHARKAGLSHLVGTVPLRSAIISGGFGALALLVAFGASVVPMTLLAAAVTLGVGLLAKRKIRGQTGDVLGASQQLAETALLLYLIT